MRVDAENDDIARLTCEKDNRTTPIDKFIRMFRFNELSQIFNILAEQISVIGSSVERAKTTAQDEQKTKISVAVSSESRLNRLRANLRQIQHYTLFKMQMDLIYIKEQLIIEDLCLILRTVKILFMPESAEDVGTNATTAVSHRDMNTLIVLGRITWDAHNHWFR